MNKELCMKCIYCVYVVCAQAIAKGVGSGVDDSVSLDVHAINELKDKGFPATDDSAKYCYTADSSGNYSEIFCRYLLCRVCVCLFVCVCVCMCLYVRLYICIHSCICM